MKITNMRRVNGSGKVRAFFSVELQGQGITLNDFKLIEGAKGYFTAPPSRSYEKDGETKYADIINVEREVMDDIRSLALDVFNGRAPQPSSEPRDGQRGYQPEHDIPFKKPVTGCQGGRLTF